MNKKCVFTIAMYLGTLLGCGQNGNIFTQKELTSELYELNWFANEPGQLRIERNLELPFTETYLKKRHDLLQRADLDNFVETAAQEAQYLSIQQRYPERFLPWPVHLNLPVIAQAHQVESSQMDAWYGYVEARLNEARESKIVLNRVERQQLLDYLTPDITTQSKAAQRLAEYLASYRVRSSLGMYQLPNGKEWYQSKLNFYSGSVKPPEALLNKLQSLTSEYGEGTIDRVNFSLNQPLVHQLLAACDTRAGLNWRDGFVSLQQTASQCEQTLTNTERLFAVVMMEVDLGVHYFAWSQKQALLALQSRLALNEDQAFVVLKDILFFPATSFALLSQITSA
ncbi:hypothetical protein [Pseudoalteromonas rubra]|uniref:hypothetical protein n=1 Tax=Pseudoalteromonas rubra TaxID=43658 RepID=UPI000F78B1D1|nr:hypothetical protein [Pseudoalteromonas rubra]